MAFITKDELRAAAGRVRVQKSYRTTDAILREEVAASKSSSSFDVFLSHSFSDKELVLGAKHKIEDQGLTVYIDWLEDTQLDRTAVSPETANTLRIRMKQCRALIYAHTKNTVNSKWCPWELGYFDALKSKVFILPVADKKEDTFPAQEYVGLYPYISEDFNELKIIPLNETQSVTARVLRKSLKDAVRS